MGFESALLVVQIWVAVSQLSVEGSPVKVPVPSNGIQATYPTEAGQPPPIFPDHDALPPSSSGRATHQNPVATSPETTFNSSSIRHSSPPKAYHQHHALKPSSISLAPAASFPTTPKWRHGLATSPSVSFRKYYHSRKRFDHSTPGPSAPVHIHAYNIPGPSVSPSQSSIPSWAASASAPSVSIPLNVRPIVPPEISPSGAPLVDKKAPPPLFVMALPPPPPNENCLSVTCTDPLTYTPPGSPCGCVWPIQVKLQLGIPIYTFFTSVSELAGDIASVLVLSPSQVRVMGANAASQELDKCTVLIDLVPWEVKFDYATAIFIYNKFWKRQVFIKASLFGPYKVVYVHYPGLPPSPPSASSEISAIDNEPYSRHPTDGQSLKPLGVDVPRKKKDGGLRRSVIAAIVLSSFTALLVFLGVIWLFLLKCGTIVKQPGQMQQNVTYSAMKPSVAVKSLRGSISSSGSVSHSSSTFTCTGSAKNFTFQEIQQATNGLHASRIIGEGGFGIVYKGTLDDGNEVAIKILKKDNQHGDREFLAEVEMLSRLHHRNLVKLIGICNEDEARCLVYELVPNQSLDSHLHGVDKDVSPLDWGVRMKIALGAARGLAYLHEDSNPRVIHRDFKSSNILLENDFTPKVSDFGLARTALDEGTKFTSTRVMGTFGYLAPEYAMTGHLLVKSDVYSYGVVLLELLTGRKPVDLSQPPGQENLVTWARPLLTSKVGLELVIDPAIKTHTSWDSITKVAAIASMCVQPEVSHRPFMGEVVQALKLVCNEFDETQAFGTKGSAPGSYASVESKDGVSSEFLTVERRFDLFPESGLRCERGIVLSASDYFIVPVGLEEQEYGSVRRNSISGPLRTESRRPFWQRLTSSSRGSRSEHGFSTVNL